MKMFASELARKKVTRILVISHSPRHKEDISKYWEQDLYFSIQAKWRVSSAKMNLICIGLISFGQRRIDDFGIYVYF